MRNKISAAVRAGTVAAALSQAGRQGQPDVTHPDYSDSAARP
jgi:hypothetical protein